MGEPTSSAPTVDASSEVGAGLNRAKDNGLRAGAIGLGGVLFLSFAAMSPLTGALGNVPYAIGFGNGVGAPAGFIVGGAILVLFSVGYVAMARRITTSGGLYSFVSQGLGRPLGMASGWAAVASYTVIEAAVLGGFAYFGRNAALKYFDVNIPWPVLAVVALLAIVVLCHFDVRVGTKVLGVALIAEVLVLVVMDVAVFVKGGAAGIPLSTVNPVHAFQGAAPGVGIFFAIYCWTGFETIPNFAEESKDPHRTGARALYIAVIVEGLFFVVTVLAVIAGWGADKAVDAAAKDPGNFFFAVTSRFAGSASADIMQWLIITSTFACALAFHNTAARYLYAIGREGILHRRLGHSHPKWKSPHIASAATGVIVAVLVALSILLWAVSPSAHALADFESMVYVELYGWYGIIATFLILTNLTLCSLACIRYFRQEHVRQYGHPWRTLVAPATSAVLLVGLLYLLWTNITTFGGESTFVHVIPYLCIGWFLVGLALALVLRRR